MPTETPYATLSPDLVLDALEAAGFAPTGALMALNSYENRVYQLELDDGSFVVTKFYRPGRWTNAQILEEHAFVAELAQAELPCVTPHRRDGTTLFEHSQYRFAVYPRVGGHAPDLEIVEDLKVLARTLARIHAVGAAGRFEHRITLDLNSFGTISRADVLASNLLPLELETAYATVTEHLLAQMQGRLDHLRTQRIHGDCHLGNLLWRAPIPNFVDFDDCLTGPPVQDLWMLLAGEREEQQQRLATVLEAYALFHDFDYASLGAIEVLRTLRIMHHSAWIARRWEDPAFPIAFPWFGSQRYWSDHILELREQQAALDEPPLQV
jgi:Ser/Thr protein kinase RdoA (MazF antagonist)